MVQISLSGMRACRQRGFVNVITVSMWFVYRVFYSIVGLQPHSVPLWVVADMTLAAITTFGVSEAARAVGVQLLWVGPQRKLTLQHAVKFSRA